MFSIIVKVFPSAACDCVVEKSDGRLQVFTKAPAQKGLANFYTKKLLEEFYREKEKEEGRENIISVIIIRGHNQQNKHVRVYRG